MTAVAPEAAANEAVAVPPGYRRYHPGTQPDYGIDDYASTRKRAPSQPLVAMAQTISEMTGPRFGTFRLPTTSNR